MSEGIPGVGRIMSPLGSGRMKITPKLNAYEYNMIYEAVADLTEARGRALVTAIVRYAQRISVESS